MNNSLEDKIKELKVGYLKKLEDVLAELIALLNAEKINVDELYSKIHTIAGTSGMYGLHELSNISTDFELYLKEVKADVDSVNEDALRTKFSKYLLNLRDILAGE